MVGSQPDNAKHKCGQGGDACSARRAPRDLFGATKPLSLAVGSKEESIMSIIRAARPQSNFYILDKRISEDRGLTWAARGLLIFLLGKPDNWRISPEHLRKETETTTKPTGRDGIYAILTELITSGYVERRANRKEDGTLAGYDYIVYDEPILLGDVEINPFPPKPDTASPDTAQPFPANPTLVSTDVKEVLKPIRTQLVLPDWLPTENWQGFVEMRQKIRKPMTQRAASMVLKKLEGFMQAGQDVAAILDQSVVKSWQDVFPIRQQYQQHGQSQSGMNKQEALEARNRQIAMQLVAEMSGGTQ